ncbi:hypothetical protein NDS46_30270 (plasmid) [Paenibacillus thiaminolyticus]|uniref:hypothetical protein n=1 Tax=Paenibacillus thiaminolyticus TaxID=49283 RepID=UPI00232D7234|nr:hypothetical protein [Paenibacillus thiaminolyticus]WCF11634.1 hypothetical protein NDS46_30270 [Paenibacillus thiaminolyticus]
MAKNGVFDGDFSSFKEVHDYFIQERQEIQEGLEPQEILVRVGVTNHAYDRMFNTYGRQCEWSDVEDLILQKGHKLFNIRIGENLSFVNHDHTLVVVCNLQAYQGYLVLSIITVVRKVAVCYGTEIVSHVFSSKKNRL